MPPLNRMQELGDRKKAILADLAKLDETAKADDRILSEDEARRFDTLETELKTVSDEYDRLEADRQRRARIGDYQRDIATPAQPLTVPTSLASRDNPRDFFGSADWSKVRGKVPTARLRGYKSNEEAYAAGQWFRANCLGSDDAKAWLSDYGHQYLGMSGVSDATGGVLVPTEVSNAMIMLMEDYGLARQKCQRVAMTSDKWQCPRWVSGVTGYWVTEVPSSITASTPAFNQVTLAAKNLVALTKVGRNLLADSVINVANLLTDMFAYKFATEEDEALFLGDKTNTYGGISGLITECATATATIVTALTANTAFSTLDLVDFEAMIGKLRRFPGIRPEWYIHPAGWAASMMRLADAAGGVTAAEIEGKRKEMFLGYPVNFALPMNSTLTAQTSTNGLCYFGDLRMAVSFGDRQSMEVQRLNELYANTLEIGFQALERVDINVHDVGDTSVAGAVVMLATPSS